MCGERADDRDARRLLTRDEKSFVMRVGEIMNPGCQFLNPDDTAARAAQLMANHDLGAVPVADDDKLVGMLTDRDVVVRGLAQGRDVTAAPVADLMTDAVYYCYDDQECAEVAASMGEMQVRRMPVINREKRLVGMVSLGDLAAKGEASAAGAALQGVSQ